MYVKCYIVYIYCIYENSNWNDMKIAVTCTFPLSKASCCQVGNFRASFLTSRGLTHRDTRSLLLLFLGIPYTELKGTSLLSVGWCNLSKNYWNMVIMRTYFNLRECIKYRPLLTYRDSLCCYGIELHFSAF